MNLQDMVRILAAGRHTVEKRWIFLLIVSFLSSPVWAERPLAGPAWSLSAEDRDQAIIELKKQWDREIASYSLADELSRLLFLQGRREEALRVLLSTYESTSLAQEKAKIRKQVQVLSRTFATTQGATHYQAGISALVSGNLKSALSRFEQVLSSESQVLDALVKKGQAQFLLGQWDSAAESFRAAIWLNPFEAEVRIWLGRALLERGELREGVREILQAWRAADAHQRGRSHWRAWAAEAYLAEGRSGAAKALVSPEALKGPEKWTSASGWAIGVWSRIDVTQQSRVKAFLNLFPSAYVQPCGESGLDLEGWDPAWLRSPPLITGRAREGSGSQ